MMDDESPSSDTLIIIINIRSSSQFAFSGRLLERGILHEEWLRMCLAGCVCTCIAVD